MWNNVLVVIAALIAVTACMKPLESWPESLGSVTQHLKVEDRKLLHKDLPFFQPYDRSTIQKCNAVCEPKRSQCGYYYIGTYAICGFFDYYVDLILSSQYGKVCNLATVPRVLDCFYNQYFNCYMEGCGMFGYRVKQKFRPLLKKISEKLPLIKIVD